MKTFLQFRKGTMFNVSQILGYSNTILDQTCELIEPDVIPLEPVETSRYNYLHIRILVNVERVY